jgi:hypothetical protein
MSMSSSIIKGCHMCGTVGVKGVCRDGGSKEQNGACGTEVVDSQHGTGGDESHILAQRTTTPQVKSFLLFLLPHVY